MLVDVNTLEHWEQVLTTVSKEHVPINCVSKVIFKLRGRKKQTVNLNRLRKEGLDLEEIETLLTNKMITMSKEIVDIDFVIDIEKVKEIIQPLTDEYMDLL